MHRALPRRSLIVLALALGAGPCWMQSVSAAAEKAAAARPTDAEQTSAAPRAWLSVGSLAGGLVLDPDLADFRWDVGGAATWGVSTMTGRGLWAAGLRLWRTHTTQSTGIPGEQRAPRVHLTSVETIGQVTLLRAWGVRAAVTGHVGRLHLGYDPDHLVLDPLGGGDPIEVSYAPIDEWIAGAGLQIARDIAWGLALGLHAERSTFSLTTLHRAGADIEEERDRFGNWAFGLDVSWSVDIP